MTPSSRTFTYAPHALSRMIQRGIPQSQAEGAVNAPTRLTHDPERGRYVAERDASTGYFIRVVYAEHSVGATLVTTIITAIRITP